MNFIQSYVRTVRLAAEHTAAAWAGLPQGDRLAIAAHFEGLLEGKPARVPASSRAADAEHAQSPASAVLPAASNPRPAFPVSVSGTAGRGSS